MKKRNYFVAVLGFLFSTLATNAQVIQVDATTSPLSLLFGRLGLGADIRITDNISVEPSIAFISKKGGSDEREYKYTSIPITVTGKYYFSPKQGADGFYADAFLKYAARTYNYTGDTYQNAQWTRAGLGMGIGYKLVSDGNFVFDVGFGIGKPFFANNVTYSGSGIQDDQLEWVDGILKFLSPLDVMTTGKLSIGYRFGGQ